MTTRGRVLFLVVLFGSLYSINLGGVGIIDYDEACYAEVSRVMWIEGEWLEPSLNGEPFFEKPPFIYWTQILGLKLFGSGSFAIRCFNALAGLACVLALYGVARRPLGSRVAFNAALILGTSIEFAVLSRIALTDAWLALWFVACLGCFFRAHERHRNGENDLGWFLAGCFLSGIAMLTKGAIGFVLPVGAAVIYLALQRRLGYLFHLKRAVPGTLILFGLGLSWYLALGFLSPGGFGFMRELFLEHHVGRFLSEKQGHGGPIVYYVPVLLAGLLPWSPWLGIALSRGELRGFDDERRRLLALFGIFAALTFVFFSIAATKLPNYIGPVFPAVALFIANGWEQERLRRRIGIGRAWRWTTLGMVGLLFLLGAAFAVSPWIVERVPDWLGEKAYKEPGLVQPMSLGFVAAVGAGWFSAGGVALLTAWRRRPTWIFPVLVAVFVGVIVVATTLVLPAYDRYLAAPLREAATAADRAASQGDRIVLISIKHKPSISYYTGRFTEYISRNDRPGIEALFDHPGGRVGIVAESLVDRLRGIGHLALLHRSGGYVVFRAGR